MPGNPKQMVVWVSGPTGAGKSSLSRILRTLKFSVVSENIPTTRFEAFIRDPKRHCEALQHEIMRSRFEEWQKVSADARIVFDRSIDEDIAIFCRMHHGLGFLDRNQLEDLKRRAQELQSVMPRPNLVLLLWPELRILKQRVEGNGQPRVIVDALEQQFELYAEWVTTRPEDVLKLDNSACTLNTVQRLLSAH